MPDALDLAEDARATATMLGWLAEHSARIGRDGDACGAELASRIAESCLAAALIRAADRWDEGRDDATCAA